MKFKYKKCGKGLGFSDILNTLLKNRGVDNPNLFLNLNHNIIEEFNNYDNISQAGYILLNHLKKESDIVIVVDNDLDGFTSATVMYKYIKDLKPSININYLVHKNKAHGLTKEIMEDVKNIPCDLMILPDASSNDYSQHKVLFDEGVDVLVLDHHQCDKYSPYACVVNNQMSKNVKNKSMTGVGVVYKFCKWLDNELKLNLADKYIDLFALGMIGDSADLRDLESRYLVLKGLKEIENKTNKNKLISKIYESKSYSMNNKCTITGTAFYMCPTINCIIRGGDEKIKSILFKAFIGTDEKFVDKVRGKGEVEMSAEEYVLRLYTKLKKQQDKIADNGVQLISKQIEDFKLNNYEIIIANGNQIEDSTYNRLVVNRISSKYNKHVLLLTDVNGVLQGSGTGAKNKEISDFRKWCELTGLFNFCAGHPSAFGCSIPMYNINDLYSLVSTIPSSDLLVYQVDEIYNEKTLNKSIVSLIGSYDDIWGNKLDEPRFAIEGIKIASKDISLIGKNKTTIKFIYNGIEFIKFKASEEEYNDIIKNEYNNFTIIGRFKVNEYNGNKSPQILIEDYIFEATQKEKKFIF